MGETTDEESFVPAIDAEAVPPGHAELVIIDGARLLVCNVDGTFYAIDDECTHDGGSLDQGELMGCLIECPRHGARFDVRDGSVKRLPATRPVGSYEARVVDGVVEVRYAVTGAADDPFGF
jgi:3-phenylpropionate/trans-cinnamate dioxygenase ferredoxin subunit